MTTARRLARSSPGLSGSPVAGNNRFVRDVSLLPVGDIGAATVMAVMDSSPASERPGDNLGDHVDGDEFDHTPVGEGERRSPVPWLVSGFLALLVVFLIVNAAVTDDAELPDGDPPPEASFELLGGGDASMVDYRGTPVLVNFFASWCTPCIRELPDIEAASQRYADEIVVLGLSVSDRPADTEALVDATGVTFTVGFDPNGDIHRAVSDLGVMPTTIFVAADGTLLSSHAGAISADELDRLIVEELLASIPDDEGDG